MYMSERETYDDNKDVMDGSISSGPVQPLRRGFRGKWVWLKSRRLRFL